jgi:hypothetical protein
MDRELEERIAAAAARGMANLRIGKPLDDVLQAFREDDRLGAIASMMALRAIEDISLKAAKELVSAACAGERFPHLGLEELRHLARIPGPPSDRSWLPTHLEGAIISGRAWKLFVRAEPGSVRYFDATTPDPSRAGSMHGSAISFDAIRDEVRGAVSQPGWSEELRIVRDEPDQLLVHFLRVRESSGR